VRISPHPLDLPNKDGRRRDKELKTIYTPKEKKKAHPGKDHEISRKQNKKDKDNITKERSQPNDNTLS
jgi:hypothetical protein